MDVKDGPSGVVPPAPLPAPLPARTTRRTVLPIQDEAYKAGDVTMTQHYSLVIAPKLLDKNFAADYAQHLDTATLKTLSDQIANSEPCSFDGTQGPKAPPTLRVQAMDKELKDKVSGVAKVLFTKYFQNRLPFDHENDPGVPATGRMMKIVFRIKGVTHDFPAMSGEDERSDNPEALEAQKKAQVLQMYISICERERDDDDDDLYLLRENRSRNRESHKKCSVETYT